MQPTVSSPALSPSFNKALSRAKSAGWKVSGSLKTSFKLTHPKAKETIIAKPGTKPGAAIRTMEEQMQRALGPVQTMAAPPSMRLDKALLAHKSASELRKFLLDDAENRRQLGQKLIDATQALLTAQTALLSMPVLQDELNDLRALRDNLADALSRVGTSYPRATMRNNIAASASRSEKKAAPSGAEKKAAPSGPAKRSSARPRKAAAPISGPQKKPAKKAAAGTSRPSKPAKAAKMEPTPLEQAINKRKRQDAGRAKRGAPSEDMPLFTGDGRPLTRENAGAMLLEYRTKRGETQQKVAPLLKCSVTTLINWENRNTIPQPPSMSRIAAYLAVGTSDKLDETGAVTHSHQASHDSSAAAGA